MAMILPRRQSFGESFGTGLGSGIGTGLQALANMKMQQMQKDQEINRALPYVQKMFPDLDKEGVRGLLMSPPHIQKEFLKQKQDEGWKNQFDQTTQMGTTQMGTAQPRTMEDMSASQLAEAMSSGSERIRRKYEPLLGIKKEEESKTFKKAENYEKRMEPIVENVNKFMTATDDARQFVKKHPNLFGPIEGRLPQWAATDPEKMSLRNERDQIIDAIVTLSLPLEGTIGRGSNLMINLKKGSKASATMKPKEFLSTLDRMEKIYESPLKEYEDYTKMTQSGKLPADFMNKLKKRSMERYKTRGADVIDLDNSLSANNKAELDDILSNPENIGKTVTYQGKPFKLEAE